MNYNNIPPELRELDQWVNVYADSKIPMKSTQMAYASPSDKRTWSSFEDAVTAVNYKIYSHAGFVFNNNGIVGIDIDRGFDEYGFLSETAADCMSACESYTERSRSGRGVHIIVKGSLPFAGRNNRNGVEIYRSNRFFVMTGEVLVYPDMTENQRGIDYILDKYFPQNSTVSHNEFSQRIYEPVYLLPKNGKIPLRPYYPTIFEGCRNVSLLSLGGQLHSMGYSPVDIYDELCVVNAYACTPPLDEREIERIICSVIKYER